MSDMVPIRFDGQQRPQGLDSMKVCLTEFDGNTDEILEAVKTFDFHEYEKLQAVWDLIQSRMVHWSWKDPDADIGSYQERWDDAVEKIVNEIEEMN